MKNVSLSLTGVGLLALTLLSPSLTRAQDMAALRGQDAPANAVWLDTLDLGNVTQDYGKPQAGKSVDLNPMTMSGVVYPHGLGTHAMSRLVVSLKGGAVRFDAVAGVDDEKKTGPASVQFEVFVDGNKKLQTPTLHGGDAPVPISVDLTGAKKMTLVVTDGDDGIDSDHADWAGALLTLAPGAADKPVTMADVVPAEPPLPIHVGDSPVPAIHGPRITGATPGHPFLFRIPATGTGPLTYGAKNLPAGLTLDKTTGIITGALTAAGTTKVRLMVSGPRGPGGAESDHRRRRSPAGPDAAAGLELLERLGGGRGREEGPGRRRPDPRRRAGGPRLPVRQH